MSWPENITPEFQRALVDPAYAEVYRRNLGVTLEIVVKFAEVFAALDILMRESPELADRVIDALHETMAKLPRGN